MNPDTSSPPPDGCEVLQRQISELADASAPLSPEILAHLQSCAACAEFEKTWYPKGPEALSKPVIVANDGHLRERILAAASKPEIIPFPAATERRMNWSAWVGQIAACIALTALAWSLLDPKLSQLKTRNVAIAEPTLAQSLAQMEGGTKHEQEILRTALADGGQHVQGDVEWTLSALE